MLSYDYPYVSDINFIFVYQCEQTFSKCFDCNTLRSSLPLLRCNRQDFWTLKDITLRTFYYELRAGGVVRVPVLRYARVHASVGDARVAYRQRVVERVYEQPVILAGVPQWLVVPQPVDRRHAVHHGLCRRHTFERDGVSSPDSLVLRPAPYENSTCTKNRKGNFT